MADDQNLDNIIAKRRELRNLLMAEGQLSAQKAEALSRQYKTLADIESAIGAVNREGKDFVDALNKGTEAGTELYSLSLGLTESIKEALGIQQRRNEFDKDLFKINNDIKNTLRDQTDSLSSQQDVEKQIIKNKEKVTSALTVIESLQDSLSGKSLEEVTNIENAFNARQTIENQIKKELDLVAKGKPLNQGRLDYLYDQAALLDQQVDSQIGSLNPQQQQLLFTRQNAKALEMATKAQEKQLAKIEEVNKATGVTGALLKGLSKIPGLDQVFKAEDLENIKKELLESGKEANKLDIAGKLVSKSFGNLKNVLKDPLVVLSAMGQALLRNSQLTNQFQQELGVGYNNARAMRQQLANAADTSGDLFINSEKLQKSFFALKDTTGVFFDLSSQSAETFTNLTERIGLAGAEAGNLTMLMRLQGKETEANLENMYDTTGAMLQTSKTTASVKDILGDVAKSSKGLQASLAANPQALAKAAIAARELGATLADMEKIQGALLDFEQSIGAELEAELLTGKQLNLEKARLAALNNDMAALGEELKKQNVDLASFGDMNVKQQEAIAKAMGMSRNEMGEMLLKQEMQNKSLDEIRSTMGEQAYEQAKALSAQDKFNAATAKLKDLFANVMTAFTPIIDAVAMIVEPIAWVAKWIGKLNEATGGWSNKLLGVAIIAKMLGKNLFSALNPKNYTGFFSGLFNKIKGISFGGLQDKIKDAFTPSSTDGLFKGVKDRIKGLSEPLKGLKDKLMGAFSGAADKAKGIQFDPRMAGGGRFRDMASGRMVSEETANAAGVFKPGKGPADAVKGVADKTSDAASKAGKTAAPKDNGQALKEKMQNIAEGIKSFADPKVLLGGLYMIASAPGLIVLGVASLPLKIVEKLNGPKLMASMQGIASGVASFASASAGILPLIGAAGALAILTLGLPGLIGISLLGAPAAAGLAALSGGLMALGTAAATGIPFLGAALLAAFGAALIPFGFALGLAAPAIEAVGTVIATTIMAIADAVVTVMPALTQGLIDLATQIPIANLLALAFSLPSLAFGVGLLGGALLLSAPGLLIGSFTLPLIGPAITQLGESLAGIDTAAFFQFGIGMAALTAAFALAGLAYPLIIGGSLALSLALIPLTAMLALAAPVIETFSNSITALSEIDVASLFGLALALPSLAMGLMPIALMSPMIALASLTLMGLGMALMPLSIASEGLDVTSNSLLKIAEAIQTLDIGRIATLSVAVGGLTASLLGLMALGPLALGAIAVMGGGAAIGTGTGTGVGAAVSPGGGGASAANAGGMAGEEVRAIVKETVTATIKALVPEMVAAIGNVKVVNDNFHNSRQSEGPSRNRQITNNNFA